MDVHCAVTLRAVLSKCTSAYPVRDKGRDIAKKSHENNNSKNKFGLLLHNYIDNLYERRNTNHQIFFVSIAFSRLM